MEQKFVRNGKLCEWLAVTTQPTLPEIFVCMIGAKPEYLRYYNSFPDFLVSCRYWMV